MINKTKRQKMKKEDEEAGEEKGEKEKYEGRGEEKIGGRERGEGSSLIY